MDFISSATGNTCSTARGEHILHAFRLSLDPLVSVRSAVVWRTNTYRDTLYTAQPVCPYAKIHVVSDHTALRELRALLEAFGWGRMLLKHLWIPVSPAGQTPRRRNGQNELCGPGPLHASTWHHRTSLLSLRGCWSEVRLGRCWRVDGARIAVCFDQSQLVA